MGYMKDYYFERPDSDYPGYEDMFGYHPDEDEEEEVEDDYPDE